MIDALIDGERRSTVVADPARGRMRTAGKLADAGPLTSVPGFGDVVAWAWLAEIGPAPHLWLASREKLACWVTQACSTALNRIATRVSRAAMAWRLRRP